MRYQTDYSFHLRMTSGGFLPPDLTGFILSFIRFILYTEPTPTNQAFFLNLHGLLPSIHISNLCVLSLFPGFFYSFSPSMEVLPAFSVSDYSCVY